MRAESGRSLIEMLGTLAIMGILSIAGIWAYNTAMDNLRANTIINEAQKRAVSVAGQIGLMGSTHPTLGEFKENTFGGGTFSTSVTTEGLYKQFGIQVSGVSKHVCQNIWNSIDNGTPIRRLATTENPRVPLTVCNTENTFLLIYNENLTGSHGDTTYNCDSDTDCTICGTCYNHVCLNDCHAPSGTCDMDSECNGDNKCMICDTSTRTCKNGCQSVKYLESTGSQWIDTGANPSTYNNIVSTFSITDTSLSRNYIWGSYAFSTSGYGRSQFSYSSTGFCGYGSSYTNTLTLDVDTNIHTAVMKDRQFFVDNHLIWTSETPWDTNTTVNTYLYHVNARNSSSMSGISNGVRIHSWKCFQNTTLVRDFIPVLDPQGTPAMFDKVSTTLFYNAGSGTFLYGN